MVKKDDKKVEKLREEYTQNFSAVEQDLEVVTQKDKLEEAYNQLFSDRNLEKISQLSTNEIGKIAILKTYATEFQFTELTNIVDNFLRLRISLQRKGREEHVKVAQAEVIRDEQRLKTAYEMDKRINKG